MKSVRLWSCFAAFVAMCAAVSYEPAGAAPDPRCFDKYKCSLIACKSQAYAPNSIPLGCTNQLGDPISNCTCTLTDDTQYTICTYTTADSQCVADAATLKRCDGTYTPPQGVPTFCANQQYECNPNPPTDPMTGKPTICPTPS